MKVAALAQANDLDIAPHGSQDIHVHLVAAISNGLILEFYRDTVDPMWGRVYRHTLRLNDDGTVSPPNVPGIGADPNYAGFSSGYPALVAAIAQVGFPTIEVHISNPVRRGPVSETAKVSQGMVTGFGIAGYYLALRGLRDMLAK